MSLIQSEEDLIALLLDTDESTPPPPEAASAPKKRTRSSARIAARASQPASAASTSTATTDSDAEAGGDDQPQQLYPRQCAFWGCSELLKNNQAYLRHLSQHCTEVEISVNGNPVIAEREAADGKWVCSICPDDLLKDRVKAKGRVKKKSHAKKKHQQRRRDKKVPKPMKNQFKNLKMLHRHLQEYHHAEFKQVAKIERKQYIDYSPDVSHFIIVDIVCGAEKQTGVLVCQVCTLVPASLLAHLRDVHDVDVQDGDLKHAPEDIDINVENQLQSNQHLRQILEGHHRASLSGGKIVRGYRCTVPNCKYSHAKHKTVTKHQRIAAASDNRNVKGEHSGKMRTENCWLLRLSTGKMTRSTHYVIENSTAEMLAVIESESDSELKLVRPSKRSKHIEDLDEDLDDI
ncbi:hypothetical protein GQ42DRAFT_158931 [Ramicandelaber brevisporus]|nr:hypothetical protein GQ42DRAFT_158931 [Ramicandelaber brevisporus]